ncbi:MAG: carbohydrate kinase [Candidatus Nanopelagicales bacterium]
MITVMGEALIDIIVSPEGEVTSVVGGAPLNTARTLARLGHAVTFLGGVSSDAFGRRIRRLLDQDGVGLALGDLLAEPTSLAIAQLDPAGAATYRFMVEGTAAASVRPAQAVRALDPDTRVLHVGTLGLMLEPLAHATRAVVDSVASECLVMIDPNCRPSAMRDSAVFHPTLQAVLARADVIKVSGDDLHFLSPELDLVAAARRLQHESRALVLVTDGAQAVRVIGPRAEVVIAVPPIDVVDTVGAGDAFSGGFLSYWQSHDCLRRDLQDMDHVVAAVSFGIRVAGLTCQKAGAQPPFAADVASR